MSTDHNIQISIELQQLINADLAHHYGIIPKRNSQDIMELYIDEEKVNSQIKEELELYLGKSLVIDEISSERLNKALFVYYRKNNSDQEPTQSISPVESSFLDTLIFEAKSIGSSDLHLEVYEEESRARLRIDGVLVEKYKIP